MTNPSTEIVDEESGNIGAGTDTQTTCDDKEENDNDPCGSIVKDVGDKENEIIEADSGCDSKPSSSTGSEILVPEGAEKMDEDVPTESADAVYASMTSSEIPVVDSGSEECTRTSLQNNSSSDSELDESAIVETAESSSQEEVPAKKRKIGQHVAGINAIKHHQQLKKTQEPFVQKKPCVKLKQNLGKCIECRNPVQGRKGHEKPLCRFLFFRKLRYGPSGALSRAGFLDPSDCSEEDLKLWSPTEPPAEMNFTFAKYLLEEVGDQFCCLVKQEKETLDRWKEKSKGEEVIVWRKTVEDLRELCDVCSTTLFNYHWTCGKCGFVVCVDCFKARKEKEDQAQDENEDSTLYVLSSSEDNKDSFRWRKCHRQLHILSEMLLTQIIAKDELYELNMLVHQLREKLNIHQRCGCSLSQPGALPPLDENKCKSNVNGSAQLQEATSLMDPKAKEGCESSVSQQTENGSCSKDADSAVTQEISSSTSDKENDEEDPDGMFDSWFGANSSDEEENNEASEANNDAVAETEIPENTSSTNTNEIPSSNDATKSVPAEKELKNFVRKGKSSDYAIKTIPRKSFLNYESMTRYPDVKHQWLCQGNLLRLLEPVNPGNLKLFQEQWKRGQPVLVSDVASLLTQELWTPESFSNEFGSMANDLINCMTGKVVPQQKIKKFWDGFEYVHKRLRDDDDRPMLLKLKDWPPKADFAKVSPDRFTDLMKALPLGDYTYRDGMLNLASRLPDIFSKPDLGPKMYIAYGSGLHLDKGTTNLHLDISDAVNVMVYVGKVKDADLTEHDKAVEKAVMESDCDNVTIRRVVDKQDLPGALWHIWEAKDADKIRDMCNSILVNERGLKVDAHHDAIHDQQWYLDRDLRQRLMEEYNVIGYPIIQCAGDAVFIPAGAPHQVRNLNNCIKIAEDFVSPENVGHCFHLTEEFRNLTDTHTNHEDKLQIKNIVYHTIKDAVAVILSSL